MIRIDRSHPSAHLHASLRLERHRIPHREDDEGLLVTGEDAAAAFDLLC